MSAELASDLQNLICGGVQLSERKHISELYRTMPFRGPALSTRFRVEDLAAEVPNHMS